MPAPALLAPLFAILPDFMKEYKYVVIAFFIFIIILVIIGVLWMFGMLAWFSDDMSVTGLVKRSDSSKSETEGLSNIIPMVKRTDWTTTENLSNIAPLIKRDDRFTGSEYADKLERAASKEVSNASNVEGLSNLMPLVKRDDRMTVESNKSELVDDLYFPVYRTDQFSLPSIKSAGNRVSDYVEKAYGGNLYPGGVNFAEI